MVGRRRNPSVPHVGHVLCDAQVHPEQPAEGNSVNKFEVSGKRMDRLVSFMVSLRERMTAEKQRKSNL